MVRIVAAEAEAAGAAAAAPAASVLANVRHVVVLVEGAKRTKDEQGEQLKDAQQRQTEEDRALDVGEEVHCIRLTGSFNTGAISAANKGRRPEGVDVGEADGHQCQSGSQQQQRDKGGGVHS